MGVITIREALTMAQKRGLDLVEISPTAKPPVCRIMDFGKYKYEQDRKDRQAKKHQSVVKIKEIKFHLNVAEHDFETKMRHAKEFLEEGHRVKFSLFFRGRENAHQNLGFQVMNRAAQICQEFGVVEQSPRLIGKTIIMLACARSGSAAPREPKAAVEKPAPKGPGPVGPAPTNP